MVSEEVFLKVFYITLDPRGGASLDPRELNGRIYVGDPYQISKLWASWFKRRRFLKFFPILTLDPPGWASLEPKGLISRINVEDHLALLHIHGGKFKMSKILNFKNPNFKLCRMPTKLNIFKFK